MFVSVIGKAVSVHRYCESYRLGDYIIHKNV